MVSSTIKYYHEQVRDIEAVVKDGAYDTGQYDMAVLQAVNPAMVKYSDELNDTRSIKCSHGDDTTKPSSLEKKDNHGVGEVSQDGHTDGPKCDRGHPNVREQGEDGAHIRMNL